MFSAFFDESSDGVVFLVGGWVATSSVWDRFAADWTAVLNSDPPIGYFKHHQAKTNPPTGQFAGWPAELVERKLETLVDVICAHDMYGAITGLKIETHNAAFASDILAPKQLRSIMKLSHYYQCCVFSATAMVCQIQLEHGETTETVDFIFDEMSGLLKECISFHEEARALFPPPVRAIAGRLIEGNDNLVGPLQAADLLAGQATMNSRLGRPDKQWPKLATAHRIYQTTAYLPQFETVPDLVKQVDTYWTGLQYVRGLKKEVMSEEESKTLKNLLSQVLGNRER